MLPRFTAANGTTSAQQHHIAQGLKKLLVSHDSAEVQNIADWLAPGTSSGHQADVFTHILPGTGQWIFTSPRYREWLDGGQTRLLLSGIPGAGKTILASNIIHNLQNSATPENGSAVAFFYSSFRRHDDQSSLSIISSLVRQLFLQGSENGHEVQQLYEEHKKRQTRPNQKDISSALESLLLGFSKVAFVIDALDECKDSSGLGAPWKDVVKLIFDMQDKLSAKVVIQILATSRPITEDYELFGELERLDIYAMDDDLAMFCDAMIPRIELRCAEH